MLKVATPLILVQQAFLWASHPGGSGPCGADDAACVISTESMLPHSRQEPHLAAPTITEPLLMDGKSFQFRTVLRVLAAQLRVLTLHDEREKAAG